MSEQQQERRERLAEELHHAENALTRATTANAALTREVNRLREENDALRAENADLARSLSRVREVLSADVTRGHCGPMED